MRTIRVLCVDDHDLLKAGLRSRFEHERDIELVGELASAEGLVDESRRLRPDVVLLDLEMPGPDPFDAISEMQRVVPHSKVIILSAYVRDNYIDAATKAGAWGYVSKTDEVEEIVGAIRDVVEGKFVFGDTVKERCQLVDGVSGRPKKPPPSKLDSLTPREREILRMIGRGKTRTEIAEELHRSPRTIDNHRASIMRKLEISDRVELVRYAIREGLVEV